MELIAALFVVLGIAAVIARFLPDAGARGSRLPRVIDDSLGMWLVRRALGRAPGLRADQDPGTDPLATFRRPSTVLARRAVPMRQATSRPSGGSRWAARR